jgi:hypothetical protein
VLADGCGKLHVADATTLQIARARVMDGVAAPPMIVGRQGHTPMARAQASRSPTDGGRMRRGRQLCWITNSRARKPAAGTAMIRVSQ